MSPNTPTSQLRRYSYADWSPNYNYTTQHRRSDSISLGRRGSQVSSISSSRFDTFGSTPPPSPRGGGLGHNNLNTQGRRNSNVFTLSEKLPTAPTTATVTPMSTPAPVIDLDRITEEYDKDRGRLSQKEIKWCKFLKETPVDTDMYWNSRTSSEASLPKTSENLLNKYNNNYRIEDEVDECPSLKSGRKKGPLKLTIKKLTRFV